MKYLQIFLLVSLFCAVLTSMPGCFSASPTDPHETSGKTSVKQGEAPFEGGWELVSMNGLALTLKAPITIRFADGKAGGFSGCNLYGGSYTYHTDASENSRIAISEIMATETACLDRGTMQLETAYLRILQSPLRVEYQNDRLRLHSEEGQLEYIKSERQIPLGSSGGDDTPVSSN